MRQPHSTMPVIKTLFHMLQLTPRDRFCDCGCGDGRIVFLAAKNCGCQSVGFEWDHEMTQIAENTQQWMESKATIKKTDYRKADLSTFTVVYAYLKPEELFEDFPYDTATVVFHDYKPKTAKPYLTVSVGRLGKLFFCGRKLPWQ